MQHCVFPKNDCILFGLLFTPLFKCFLLLCKAVLHRLPNGLLPLVLSSVILFCLCLHDFPQLPHLVLQRLNALRLLTAP